MYICGEKIIMRAVEMKDNAMLLDLINDPETEAMLGGSSLPISLSEQIKWFESLEKNKDILRCIIESKEDGTAVGTIILSDIDSKNGTAQIHIKMKKDGGRGKGYGTDAIKSIVKYAFDEMRLNCIFANILSYNEASKKTFEKCGFKCEGTLRSRIYKSGGFIDVLSYSVLKNDIQ